jgi:small-conductance mechanosensitive channel
MPQLPAEYTHIVVKAILSIAVLVIAMAINRALSNAFRRSSELTARTQTLHMVLRNAVFAFACTIAVFVWLGFGNFAVFIGILGAGIAFASQEVIGSFAGYLNIVTGSLYQIGDRIRIGDVVGDVMDITLLRTTLMEIGEWVKADQYTGRIVSVANRTVFASPVFNYTQRFHFLWDEIAIPITYNSDWRRAGELMLEHGREYSSILLPEAEGELRQMKERYPLEETVVEPTLYMLMTDNWIEMTLRYIVEARKRRPVRAKLHRELLQHFEADEQITVASATFEIVGFPPLRGEAQTRAPTEHSSPMQVQQRANTGAKGASEGT